MNETEVIMAGKVTRALALAILASGAPPAPEWFKPRMRPMPGDRWEVEGKVVSPGEAVMINRSAYRGLARVPVAVNAARDEQEKWANERETEIVKQWPAAYARMVLAELGRTEGE